MKELLEEIFEIPEKARLCYQKNQKIKLPLAVPYLGMGSSYYAPLVLFYCGKDINPQIASEYYYYLSKNIQPLGVLISQSGKSSETVWSLERFKEVLVITNNPDSSLGKSKKAKKIIQLWAGEEKFPANKTFINTLTVLYLGLGINPLAAILSLEKNLNSFKEKAKKQAEEIFKYISPRQVNGLYVIGSGPNLGVAYKGALALSEATKLSWAGLSLGQYDHGPKETAKNTVVIILNSKGKDKKRIEVVKKKIQLKSNALVVEITETNLPERLSPFTMAIKLNFIMNYLIDYLGVDDVFEIGSKITTISDTIK